MYSELLYSRWGFFVDTFSIINDYEDLKYNRIIIYEKSIKHIRCKIYLENNYIVFDHYSTFTGLKTAKFLISEKPTNNIIISPCWNQKNNHLGLIINNKSFLIEIEESTNLVNFDENGIPVILDKAISDFRIMQQ